MARSQEQKAISGPMNMGIFLQTQPQKHQMLITRALTRKTDSQGKVQSAFKKTKEMRRRERQSGRNRKKKKETTLKTSDPPSPSTATQAAPTPSARPPPSHSTAPAASTPSDFPADETPSLPPQQSPSSAAPTHPGPPRSTGNRKSRLGSSRRRE